MKLPVATANQYEQGEMNAYLQGAERKAEETE
jgi:hypothetical protein